MNISLKHGTKVYAPDIYALSACDLEVKAGEFLVVMGPSGCGKSTLLKVLAGIEPLTAGELYLDGIPSTSLAPTDRDVSLVFQEYVLYPNKTVYENIMAGISHRNVPYEQAVQRAQEAMALLDLTDLRDQRPKTLSGGQQQRTALAKALVRRSRLVLLDEPMSNVSESARSEYCRLLAFLKQSLPESTFLYVTHNVKEALLLADRIAFMEDGRLLGTVQTGALQGRILPEDPAQLLEAPFFQNTFRLPCSLSGQRLRMGQTEIQLPASVTARLLRLPEKAQAELKTEKLSKTPLMYGIPLVLTVEENGGNYLKLSLEDTEFYLHKRTALQPGNRIRMYYDVREMTFFDEAGKCSTWYSLGGNVFPGNMLGLGGKDRYFLPYDAISPASGGEAHQIRAECCLQEEDMGTYKIAYYEVQGLPGQVAAKLGPKDRGFVPRLRLALDPSRALRLPEQESEE